MKFHKRHKEQITLLWDKFKKLHKSEEIKIAKYCREDREHSQEPKKKGGSRKWKLAKIQYFEVECTENLISRENVC